MVSHRSFRACRCFFFSSRRRHTRCSRDWSSDVCSSDLNRFNLVIFPDPVYCGRISNGRGFRLLKEFTIAEDRGLKDVLVMLTGIQRGKPFDFPVTRIEARDCRFLPYINVLRGVGKVEVVNMDPVMHDIQAYETSELGPRVLFNVPLPMNPHHPKTAGEKNAWPQFRGFVSLNVMHDRI